MRISSVLQSLWALAANVAKPAGTPAPVTPTPLAGPATVTDADVTLREIDISAFRAADAPPVATGETRTVGQMIGAQGLKIR
jgi:hypothetical protein